MPLLKKRPFAGLADRNLFRSLARKKRVAVKPSVQGVAVNSGVLRAQSAFIAGEAVSASSGGVAPKKLTRTVKVNLPLRSSDLDAKSVRPVSLKLGQGELPKHVPFVPQYYNTVPFSERAGRKLVVPVELMAREKRFVAGALGESLLGALGNREKAVELLKRVNSLGDAGSVVAKNLFGDAIVLGWANPRVGALGAPALSVFDLQNIVRAVGQVSGADLAMAKGLAEKKAMQRGWRQGLKGFFGELFGGRVKGAFRAIRGVVGGKTLVSDVMVGVPVKGGVEKQVALSFDVVSGKYRLKFVLGKKSVELNL